MTALQERPSLIESPKKELEIHPSKKMEELEEYGVLNRVFQYHWYTNLNNRPTIHTNLFIAPPKRLKNKAEIDAFLELLPLAHRERKDEYDSSELIWLPQITYQIELATLETQIVFNQITDYDKILSEVIVASPNPPILPHKVRLTNDMTVIVFPTPELAQATVNVNLSSYQQFQTDLYNPNRSALDVSNYSNRQQRDLDTYIPAELWPEKLILN